MSEENTNQTADQQAENQAEGQETTAQQAEEQTQSFKQEDVNNIVAKESKKAQEKLLKQLGIEDFDNAKEGMKKFKEWKEQQMSDQEKQAEQLKMLEKNYNSTAEENATLKAQVSAFKAGVNPEFTEDVVTLAKGQVSDDVTIDDAIKKVVEKYPHFKGEQQEEGKPSFSTGKHQSEGSSDAFANTLLGKG